MSVQFYAYVLASAVGLGSLSAIFVLLSSVEVKGNVGLLSVGTFFILAIASSCIVYPFLVRLIGRKYSLLLGDASIIVFGVAMLFPTPAVTIITRALTGLMESPIWSATFAIAASYRVPALEDASDKSGKGKVLRLITILGCAQAIMNLVPFAILRNSIAEPGLGGVDNITQYDDCGAKDCPYTYATKSYDPVFSRLIPLVTSLYIVVGIFTVLQTGMLIVHWVVVPNDLDNNDSEGENLLNEGDKQSVKQPSRKWDILQRLKDSLVAVRNNLVTATGLLTAPSQFFYGLYVGFIWSNYSRSFVSCVCGVRVVGLCMFITILCSTIVSLIIAFVKFKVSVPFLSVVNAVAALPTFGIAVWWVPDVNTLYIPYVLAVLFGICHGFARTIAYTIPVTYFPDIDTGYTLCSCWIAIGTLVSQLISIWLCTISVLYVVASVLLLSLCALVLGDYLHNAALNKQTNPR